MFLAAAWGSYLLTGDARIPSEPCVIHSEGRSSEENQEPAWPLGIENYGDSSQWPAGVDISAAPATGC